MATTKIRGDQIRLQATGGLEHNSLASTGGLQINITGATYMGAGSANNSDLVLIQDMSVTGTPLRHVKLSQLPGGGGGSVAGSDTQLQYNDGGSFGGAADLTYNDSTGDITIGSSTGDAKLFFRDSGLYISSNADGDLDIVSDGTGIDSINLESAGGITLDAGSTTHGVTYEDDGTPMLQITNVASNVVLKPLVDAKDIIFRQYDDTEVMRIEDDASVSIGSLIRPDSADGAALGSATYEWSDLFLADGGTVTFGNDQDIVLAHVADTGLTLKHTATGDDKPVSLTLQTGETDIAADDVIGKIDFQAPDEGEGTDAILVAAGIEAVSEGDFSSTANATKLSFKTAASEAAAEKMSLSSAGLLTVAGRVVTDDTTEATSTTDGSLQTDGGLSVAKSAVVGDDLDLLSDAAIVNFGADKDVNLTHVADTGLLLNSTRKIQFNDSSQYIGASSAADLDLAATTDINLDCTTVDVNGALDVSSTSTLAGTVTVGGGIGSSGVTISDAGAISADARIITDDTTEATSTTDGSLQTDGGLSVAKSAVIGDDLDLLSDSAILNMGADKDITLTHDGTSGLTIAATPISINSTGDLTLDSSTDIVLDAAGGNFEFKDAGTLQLTIDVDGTAGDIDVNLGVDGDDLVFNQYDGTEVLRLTDGGSVEVKDNLSLKSDSAVLKFGADEEITITHAADSGLVLEGNGVTALPVFTLKNTNADATGGTLKFLKDGSSVADADVIGNIDFASEDDGSNAHTFARILAKVDDMTGGQEEGSLEFHVAEYDGTLTKGMDIVGLGSDGNVTVDISTHDGSAGGLKLGGTLVTATAAELNIMDGGETATSTTLVDADRVVVNDNGTMVQVAMSDVKTYIDAVSLSSANTFTADQTIGGTTPRLTIGDAGAEDADIIFDGNAVDYRVGLDDGTDKLEIGVGSTMGTTTAITVDSSQQVSVIATTAASTATDGALYVAGGASVAGDIVVGDDLSLLSDSAVLKFGAGNDVTFTHDGGTGMDVASAGDFDIAVSAGDATFTVADTKTLILGQTGASELKLSPHSTAGSELASLINTAGTTDGSDAAGSILLSAVAGGIGLAWADGKDLWAEGGRFVVTANEDAADAIKLHADAGTSQTITIVNDAGTSATEGSAAVQILASAGGVNIKSALNNANAILLTADGGTSETIKVHADQGTSATSIELASDAGGISILAGNTTHGVKIATGTSGVPVSIGHSTSETTVNDNLTVTGDLTVNGTTITINSTTMTVDDPILTLGGDSAPGSDDNKDRGVVFRWHNGSSAKIGFMGYDDSAGVIALASDVSLSSEVATISSYATVRVATIDIGGATVLSSTGSAKVASPVAANGLQHSSGQLYIDWVRDVFTSGSLTGATYTSVDGVSLAITSGLTATLTQTPLEDAAVMVFLNGMLQRPSASHDAGASLGGAYDYKLSSGVLRMSNIVDSDAVLQVSYIKQ